jgi:hypothetical protein
MKTGILYLLIILFSSLLLSYSLGTFMREGFTESDNDLIIDTKKLNTTQQQALNNFFATNSSFSSPNIVSTKKNKVSINRTMLTPQDIEALSLFVKQQTALDPSFTSALPKPSASSLAAEQAAADATYAAQHSTGQASSAASVPSAPSTSITSKLSQMFDDAKNTVEGAVTDNNTNVYNRSQQRYDSYQGPAGDTVLVSPPPPQTVGQPSFSTPSPYPSYPPPPPQFNPNRNSLGIPYSQIPQGQTDLYILKSEVIPPVCPACPNVSACAKPPPPCPACARCPEPAFECKKVPSYRGDNNYLPMPVLSDFSQFGM